MEILNCLTEIIFRSEDTPPCFNKKKVFKKNSGKILESYRH